MFYSWYTVRAITTVLQETFYRVPDLYTGGVVNIFLHRDLKSLQLKYILEARYYAILRNI